jgi:hypothetical protein
VLLLWRTAALLLTAGTLYEPLYSYSYSYVVGPIYAGSQVVHPWYRCMLLHHSSWEILGLAHPNIPC